MTSRLALVTGGTGCVGANLVAGLCARGWRVRVLRRTSSSTAALDGLAEGQDYDTAWGDVRDADAVAAALRGVSHVFHVAGIAGAGRRDVALTYAVNVDGTRIVMQAALAAGVDRVVHTSSCAVLGVPRGRPADEQHALHRKPHELHYAHSKLLAEYEVQKAVQAGLPAVIVNPAAVLGPRDVNFVSGRLLREAKRGLLKAVPPGGLTVVHADDVVAGHVAAAERGVPGERYILAGESITHRALGRLVCATVGVRAPLFVVPRLLMPLLAASVGVFEQVAGQGLPITSEQLRLSREFMYFDGSKARRTFDLPLTPARVAIEDAWRWYREHGLL